MAPVISPKQQFLDAYEREHEITMRLLRAYPTDKLDLRPAPALKTARELAWVFVVERGLGTMAYHNAFAKGMPSGGTPSAPASWDDLLAALEREHKAFGDLVRAASEDELFEPVKFFTGPKTLSDWPRMQLLWFLLSDQIHHRGQFSIYARIAGGKVPSIYGPSADEPWM